MRTGIATTEFELGIDPTEQYTSVWELVQDMNVETVSVSGGTEGKEVIDMDGRDRMRKWRLMDRSPQNTATALRMRMPTLSSTWGFRSKI